MINTWHYPNRLHQAIKRRNSYAVLCLALLVLNGLLIGVVYRQKTRIILVPPIIQRPMWLQGNRVSASYLIQWSTYLCFLRFNTTPSNVVYLHHQLIKYVHPRLFGQFQQELVQEQQHIKQHVLSMAFDPINIQAHPKTLTVFVYGKLRSWLGDQSLTSHTVHYQLQYKAQGGQLLLTHFKQLEQHRAK